MAAPKWAAGKTYLPGAVVQPLSSAGVTIEPLLNPDFEAGSLTGWDVTPTGTGTASAGTGRPFAGTYAARWTGAYGGSGMGGGTFVVLINQAKCTCIPGQSVTVKAQIAQDDTSNSANYGAVRIYWYKADNTLISYATASKLVAGNYSNYENNSLTATAPSGAAYARMGVWLNANGEGGMWADNCAWSTNGAVAPSGLIFKAVQAGPGVSAATEPTWPTANGVTVVDNTVTWEAITASFVEWTAHPIMKSGATEPVWPANVGGTVIDGDVVWEAVDRRVLDAKCPQSKVVAIMASKVFAADKDIVRFSATANPLDWSSPDDAGYLPTGLQQANAADLAVLQPYRGNLCAWNASSFQMWQVDPDPAAMALLDQMDGVGSEWTLAAQAVGNDLYYLSQLGVRSVNIANAAENLQAGDVGIPIDPLVQEAIAISLIDLQVPISTYYPSAGQYWLAFNNYPPPQLVITGDLPDGSVGAAASGAYAVTGGIVPYGPVTVIAGSLPTGVTLSPDGSWSGAYAAAGTFAWTVRVTDAIGGVATLDDGALVGAYFLTSKPYPIYVRDDMGMSAGFTDAATKDLFKFGNADTDAMTLSAGFVSASTQSIVLNTSVTESLSFAAGFVSASTKELILNNTIPPESLSFAAGFDSASTKEVVLSNSIPPESLSFAASFISASTEPA